MKMLSYSFSFKNELKDLKWLNSCFIFYILAQQTSNRLLLMFEASLFSFYRINFVSQILNAKLWLSKRKEIITNMQNFTFLFS